MAITAETLNSIGKTMKTAREDDTPFAVYDDTLSEMSVYGDANKTENKSLDLTIAFRFTKDEFEKLNMPADTKVIVVGNYVQFSVVFNDISITPRNNSKLVEYLLTTLPYYEAIESFVQEAADKMQEAKTDEEKKKVNLEANIKMLHLFNEQSEDVVIGLYNFVATICGIDDYMAEHMLANNVINAVSEIMTTYPELFNETETLFGY